MGTTPRATFPSENSKGQVPMNIFDRNVFELPEENHLMANGYANSWVIDTDEVCGLDSRLRGNDNGARCVRNADGSYDMELIVEFWPQRLFYIGMGISGFTLFSCVFYLGFDYYKRKKLIRK